MDIVSYIKARGYSIAGGKYLAIKPDDLKAVFTDKQINDLREQRILKHTKNGAFAISADAVAPEVKQPKAKEPEVEDEGDDDEESTTLGIAGVGIALIGVVAPLTLALPNKALMAILIVGIVVGLGLSIYNLWYNWQVPHRKAIIALVITVILSIGGLGVVLGPKVSQEAPAQSHQTSKTVTAKKLKAPNSADLSQNIKVSFGKFKSNTSKEGILTTSLKATVTNMTTEDINYNISVQAYDANNKKIGDPDYLLMTKLAKGKSVSRDIFTYVTPDEAKAMSQTGVTFKIDSVGAVEK